MGNPEILAPAGGREQLIAAVRAGADAVYLGARGFNARRGAENFDSLSLREAVSYCHARNVAVYVTVNTLVTDAETEELEATARDVADSGADAVIIQDLAVLRLFRERCPGIKLHASTQTAVHNTDGAKLMRELGFSRVVLARELSLPEIRRINENAGIETEVFIHGAHCVSVSGACYLSSVIGARSGNRGLCAGPCRLDFRAAGREYALSLKDLCAVLHIGELMDAGTCSFKIEERLKRPEYVAAAVTACRDALDGKTPDIRRLQSVFSRGGLTDGYLTGQRGDNMFGRRTKEDAAASASVQGELAALYRHENRRVPVDMEMTLTAEMSRLTVRSGAYAAEAQGDAPQPARTRASDEASVRVNLEKTGGTPFYLRNFSLKSEKGLTLPASAVNALRRTALERLLKARGEVVPHEFLPPPPDEKAPSAPRIPAREPGIWCRFLKFRQIPADTDGIDRIILPAAELLKNSDRAVKFGGRLLAELPALLFPEDEERFEKTAARLRDAGVREVVADNAYAIPLARRHGFRMTGGAGLNILNTGALCEYEKAGLCGAIQSFEISAAALGATGGAIPRGIIAYGRLPLMRLRVCPAGGNCAACGGSAELTDRTGARFPLVCDGAYRTLLNSVPLYIGDRKPAGADFYALYFNLESRAECGEIIAGFIKGRAPWFGRTSGLYYRKLL